MSNNIFYITVIISAIILIGLIFTHFFAGHKVKGLLLAAFGLFCSSLGYVIGVLFPLVSDLLFVANILFIVGLLFFYLSTQRLLRRNINVIEALIISVTFTILLAVFQYVFPILTLRQIIVSVVIIYISLRQVYLLVPRLKIQPGPYLYAYLILTSVVIILQTLRLFLIAFGVNNNIIPNSTLTANNLILIVNAAVFVLLALVIIVTTSILTRNQLIREHQMLEDWATTDYLTRLPNRRKLYQYVETLISQNIAFAVVICDIDGFKSINDQYGHLVGDAVLMEYTRRLNVIKDANTFMARFGGDEFVFIFSEFEDEGALTRKIITSLKLQNIKVDNKEYNFEIKSSAGVALYPSDGKMIGELLRKADHALYKIKVTNRNTVGFFKIEDE